MDLEKEQKKAEEILRKRQEKLEKELIKAYSEALKNVRMKLAELYAKHGELTYPEMLKYNRLRRLEEWIKAELRGLTRKTDKTLKKSLGDMYEEMYYRTAWAVEGVAGVNLGYGLLDPEAVKAAIENPISGLTLSERLEKRRIDVIYAVRQEIIQGLILGESYYKMAQRMKRTLEGDAQKALLVAWTEGHRVQMAGRLAALEHASEAGVIMMKVWDATLDKRTRPAHRILDGTKVKMNENFQSPAGGYGPGPGQMGNARDDIRCRCVVRGEIEGFEPKVRRVRGEGIIPYQTYQEWAEARGIA